MAELGETQHPDPFGHALAISGQKLVELTSVAVLAGQVVARTRAEAADEEGQEEGQETGRRLRMPRGALSAWRERRRAAARREYEPALDPGWRAEAGLPEAVRAWGAAVPYEDDDMAAAAAVDAMESRIGELHPAAKRRYDGRRAAGEPRAEAMAGTVGDFAFDPGEYGAPWEPAPDPAEYGAYYDDMGAGNGADPLWRDDPLRAGFTAREPTIEDRIFGTIARLSEEWEAAGRGPVTAKAAEAELRRVGVPRDLAKRVARGLRDGAAAVPGPAAGPRTVAEYGPAAVSWPDGVGEGVTARRGRPARRGRAAGRHASTAPRQTRRARGIPFS